MAATLSQAVGTEVEPGIHCVSCVYGGNKPLNVYVLEGDAFALWVDVGIDTTPERHVLPYLIESAPSLWRKPQRVLITHADMDHYGGLRALVSLRPDTFVMAHRVDQRWIESPDDIMRDRFKRHEADGIPLSTERENLLRERGGGGGKVHLALSGGETIDVSPTGRWAILHAPGHTAGHVVLWNPETRRAIIGDAAVEWGVPDVSGNLLAPPPYFHLPDYRETVRQLQALRPERLYTSHNGILDGDAAAALLASSLEAVQTIETALEAALCDHPRGATLGELCRQVGSARSHWPKPLWPGLANPISAHLHALLETGSIERITVDGKPVYRMHREFAG